MIGLIFLAELVILAIWASLAWALDSTGRRPHSRGPFDAIIVPGCAVTSDGTPSRALARRTRLATHLMDEQLASTLVLTGGVGTFPPAESEAARDLAISQGVDPEAIRIETSSTNTEENARFAAELFEAPSGLRVLVVSDGYHCFRCRRLFARHFGVVETAGSTPGPRLRVRGAMREVLSIMRMMFLMLRTK